MAKLDQATIDVSVRIDVQQLIGWEPERIEALMEGIAKVLAAQHPPKCVHDAAKEFLESKAD